ncbi:hypothetical protein Y032_0011g1316 [Ancylostoma ceylanicum]|uniref:SAM-dependent MTase TRM10-type domain-containing protein n=2 Tax=Ancylostoma ceylanicum TaxID=53326 RepID=A0A016VFY6_9BILA|nr:hypothetical protein Y032_0011g1316 [Ancylostoma ceylanicum]
MRMRRQSECHIVGGATRASGANPLESLVNKAQMNGMGIALRRISQPCRRFLSTVSTLSDESTALSKMMPSENFVKQFIKRPSHRDKLSSLVSELDMFLDLFGKDSLPAFDDSLWTTYFQTWSAEERCEFLNDLRQEQKKANTPAPVPEGEKASESISLINQRREENGEMVYAPGFHSLLELRGQEFREVIDNMYGSRLLSMRRCDENLPKLVVDCRFLSEFSVAVQSTFARQIQALHDGNWTSRQPFDISLANFRPDSQLAKIVKRHWFFHYGPPSAGTSFSPHAFAPTLTTKSVVDACSVDRSDVMYISWRARQFLPEDAPPNIRAVVLCASNDYQPWSSSVSAAQKDGITAYRIPVERHIRFEGHSKVLPLSTTSSILRYYFRGEDLGSAIRKSVFLPAKNSRLSEKEEREVFERYKAVVQEAIARAESHSTHKRTKKPSDMPKKPKVHRYSREERRRMRAMETSSRDLSSSS